MAYSLITSVSQLSTNGSGFTTGSSIDTSGADLIILVATYFASQSTVSDSKSNSYTGLTAYTNSGAGTQIFYVQAPTVGSGHTFTLAGSSNFPAIAVAAFSGSVASPFDTGNDAGAGSASSATQQPGSITPSESDELVICSMTTFLTGGAVPSIDGGFTATAALNSVGGQGVGVGLAYLIQTSAAAANPTWTLNAASTIVASIASFKDTPSAGGAVLRALSLLGTGR
jgi:hypothetical protein